MTEPSIAFSKKELRSVINAFKALDEQAQEEGKKIGYDLAQYAAQEVRKTALTRTVLPFAESRMVCESHELPKSENFPTVSLVSVLAVAAIQKSYGGRLNSVLIPSNSFRIERRGHQDVAILDISSILHSAQFSLN